MLHWCLVRVPKLGGRSCLVFSGGINSHYADACYLPRMLYDAVLINKPWHVLTNDRDTVYIKCHFEEKSYCLVVTDFKQVWAEEADIAVLIAKAREQDLALETNEQISMLISQLKDHLKSLEKCTFRRLQDRIDVDYTESKGFAAFSWTFQCNPIKDAAKVLYQQVFGPMLAIIQSVPAAHLSFANGKLATFTLTTGSVNIPFILCIQVQYSRNILRRYEISVNARVVPWDTTPCLDGFEGKEDSAVG